VKVCSLCLRRSTPRQLTLVSLGAVSGHYCPEGTAIPLPCGMQSTVQPQSLNSRASLTIVHPTVIAEAGTFSNAAGIANSSDCTPCPSGYFCVAGSTAPTACNPGSVALGEGNALCTSCNPGYYQGASGATRCLPCPNGFSCPSVSTVVPIPANCLPGTFVLGTFTSADNCTQCSPGFKCLGATSPPLECPPGSYQPHSSQSGCSACGGGTYQNASAAVDCRQCIPGSYCARGVSAPLSCEAGSFSSATNLSSADECTICPVGHACGIGSLTPSQCLPGSKAAEQGQSTCELCRAGKFTRDGGSTTCQNCSAGYYCA
jgi:hypothetical protein